MPARRGKSTGRHSIIKLSVILDYFPYPHLACFSHSFRIIALLAPPTWPAINNAGDPEEGAHFNLGKPCRFPRPFNFRYKEKMI